MVDYSEAEKWEGLQESEDSEELGLEPDSESEPKSEPCKPVKNVSRVQKNRLAV